MIRLPGPPPIRIVAHTGQALDARLPALAEFCMKPGRALARHPAWLTILRDGLQHEPYALEALDPKGSVCGFLPLAFVGSLLFGRFLVSLPYLSSNGVIAENVDVETKLVDRAVELADELNVKHLELRQERRIDHAGLDGEMASKVHMRKSLPCTAAELWKSFDAKVRNQIRKGEKSELTVRWGREELLDDFYAVLSHNMRDLGTPVYSREFFERILHTFPADAELCVLSCGSQPVAAALLLHGWGISEVPTASSLREFNATCANMLMYHHLLLRAVERGQSVFDFGRSTKDGNTFKFKKQWGAQPSPAIWQYHQRAGAINDVRPDNPRYARMIRVWQKLPVGLTQKLGPHIVRGIP